MDKVDKEDFLMINVEEEVTTIPMEAGELVEAGEMMADQEMVTDQPFTIPVSSSAIKQLTGPSMRGDYLK